jgi:hypothetical protein
MEVSRQLHAPVAVPPGKESTYVLDRGLRGPQSRSGCDDKQTNEQPVDLFGQSVNQLA